MARTHVEIRTDDGICPASVFRASGSAGAVAGVIFYMDGAGIRPVLFEMAQRLANEGFLVFLPDLFDRAGPYEPVDVKTLFSDPEKRAGHASISPASSLRELPVSAARVDHGVNIGLLQEPLQEGSVELRRSQCRAVTGRGRSPPFVPHLPVSVVVREDFFERARSPWRRGEVG